MRVRVSKPFAALAPLPGTRRLCANGYDTRIPIRELLSPKNLLPFRKVHTARKNYLAIRR